MAGTITEFFGYRAEDDSAKSLKMAADKKCPFLGTTCTKVLGRTRTISGVCAIRQKSAGSPSVICCPNRLYADDYKMLHTMGKYSDAQKALKNSRKIIADTVGLNWENVSKRIIPQLIYKGQVLQREELCKTGLYFVCPMPIYTRVMTRLGGKEKIPVFPTQPAAIHFVAYDYAEELGTVRKGTIAPLDIVEEHCTTVYKIQEAFSALNLPEGNVYGNAIRRCLYG